MIEVNLLELDDIGISTVKNGIWIERDTIDSKDYAYWISLKNNKDIFKYKDIIKDWDLKNLKTLQTLELTHNGYIPTIGQFTNRGYKGLSFDLVTNKSIITTLNDLKCPYIIPTKSFIKLNYEKLAIGLYVENNEINWNTFALRFYCKNPSKLIEDLKPYIPEENYIKWKDIIKQGIRLDHWKVSFNKGKLKAIKLYIIL